MPTLNFKSILMLYLWIMTTLAATANNTNPKNSSEEPASAIEAHSSEGIEFYAQNEILQVTFEDKTIRNVYFKIRDEQGHVHYSGSTHTGTTAALLLRFNTNILPPGEYFIQMQSDRFFLSRSFEKERSSSEDAAFYEKNKS